MLRECDDMRAALDARDVGTAYRLLWQSGVSGTPTSRPAPLMGLHRTPHRASDQRVERGHEGAEIVTLDGIGDAQLRHRHLPLETRPGTAARAD
jgi:hypothetical protein